LVATAVADQLREQHEGLSAAASGHAGIEQILREHRSAQRRDSPERGCLSPTLLDAIGPRSVSASSPAAAVPSDSRGPSAATGRSRRSSAAPTATPTWPSAGGGHASPAGRGIRRFRRRDGRPPRFLRPAGVGDRQGDDRPATLPPDADLIAAYGEFADSLTRPGFLARAMALGALAADKSLDVEYQMGEYLGVANQSL
jgi:hypothetical protein